ncbi:MAG: hypothetical protein HC796_05360 [Synechococcaceae cyanobacterium RL_1_2]|nr:hypothetical protein [Synechococcaceae cyanobacterium RL_1_2]
MLTVREPENFFNYRFYSLVSDNEALLRVLDQTKRHDRVCITGKILKNPSPQPHIFLSSIKVTEPWERVDFPKEDSVDLGSLADEDTITAKVHFASEDNKILVVEYRDRVLPIYVKDPNYAQNLYRGDIVQVHYQQQPFPQQPIHLQLLEPVKVVDSVVNNHEQNLTVEGYLVKFPRSPQLKFDVYGLAVETLGIDRYFTLVNFDDPDTFMALRDRLGELWAEGSSTMEHDRHFDVNRAIKLQVTGIGNMVDREQANPQILINKLDNIVKLL